VVGAAQFDLEPGALRGPGVPGGDHLGRGDGEPVQGRGPGRVLPRGGAAGAGVGVLGGARRAGDHQGGPGTGDGPGAARGAGAPVGVGRPGAVVDEAPGGAAAGQGGGGRARRGGRRGRAAGHGRGDRGRQQDSAGRLLGLAHGWQTPRCPSRGRSGARPVGRCASTGGNGCAPTMDAAAPVRPAPGAVPRRPIWVSTSDGASGGEDASGGPPAAGAVVRAGPPTAYSAGVLSPPPHPGSRPCTLSPPASTASPRPAARCGSSPSTGTRAPASPRSPGGWPRPWAAPRCCGSTTSPATRSCSRGPGGCPTR